MSNTLEFYSDFIYNSLFAVYRDLKAIVNFVFLKKIFKNFEKEGLTVSDKFQQLVRKHPKKICLVFNDEKWTFQDLEDYTNKIARLFQEKFSLKKGDCVALYLENKPEYIGIWLGLSKLGIITALINTNLRNEALIHTINSANSKAVIFDESLEENIYEIKPTLEKNNIDLLIHGGDSKKTSAYNLSSLLKDTSSDYVDISDKPGQNDILLYIYTSGTTGLPKPAVIKQTRFYGASTGFLMVAGINPSDILFCALPLYHGSGTILGVGSAICLGTTVVLRKKFSASNFWKECIQYNCTSFIYVGEICRFLVNQPVSLLDRQHNIRLAFGNGLRKNVWEEFNERFGIKCVEFYGASEGNCTMINIVSKVGSCGFVPLINFIFKAFPVCLIKIDDNMQPIRDRKGFCIESKIGEKGLLIGIIGKETSTQYNGYANNPEASKSKIIENVFRTGQRAFNSGDLMICDSFGYMYFCDRLGDTFRWRGENVSTTEVENVISKYLNSTEVVVYGVEIPGQEGKAGMAAIKKETNIEINLQELAQNLKTNLPSYAKPIFIRLMNEVEYTGSFKAIKNNLSNEGYNINKVKDEVFYFDQNEQSYKELNKIVYDNIINSNLRL